MEEWIVSYIHSYLNIYVPNSEFSVSRKGKHMQQIRYRTIFSYKSLRINTL